jgi:organic hydroperoxide reductase OsmC/OhrA
MPAFYHEVMPLQKVMYTANTTATGGRDGMDREQAQQLIHDTHNVCPYSNATRGNIEVSLLLA